jgi:methylmalonyl-CoA mutase
LAETFADYVAQLPIDPSKLNVSFCLDRSDQVTGLKKQGFKGPFLEADGRPHHGQGATVTEELACIIHEIVQSLRTVENPSEIAATMTADQDMFMTLAKFRALRLMWGRILEASEIAFSPLRIHAETSTRMMSALDPHMNILRATLAVFGAALGGADSICVLPYSIIQGLPNAHARRMARNTQLILSEETQLWRVADAASGSGYVESLTSELCKKAWSIFREIERTGRLPDFDSGNSRSAPVTGTTSNRLAEELPAAIESQT